MVESLKNKITEDFSKKREVISKFELAFEKMIKESENESQEIIREYLKEKKHTIRYIEETNEHDKREKVEVIF